MSAETSVVVALFFVGFLIAAATFYSSFEYYQNLVKKAQYEQDTMKKARMQTDITITNITPAPSRLNFSLKNTGRTTLNASALEIFVNGTMYDQYTLSEGYTWVSESSMNVSLYPVSYSSGDRIKIITENGISDYALVP